MKKVISLILALTLIFAVSVPAFATEAENENNYDGYPVIIVRGIDFAGLTYPDGTKAINIDASKIFSLLMNPFLARVHMLDENTLVECLFEAADGILSPIACDKNGNSVEDVSMVQYHGSMANHPEFTSRLINNGEEGIVKTVIEKYGAENTYYFTYDWRKQPSVLANELLSYVEDAKATSGKDKVNIICASMGGMVTTAFMYYHGTESINSAVYLSGAQNGTYVCGDALNGRIVFEKENLLGFVNEAVDGNFFVKLLIKVFDILGSFDYITAMTNDIVANSFTKANDMVLRDCFGTLCGFWALCPDEDFESGVNTIFAGHEEEYDVLLGKIEETKQFVFSTEETLKKARADGVKISFVSNYNAGLAPVYERANLNGDGVLETELTSNFATVAPLRKVLTEEQLQSGDSKYISPDKVINASTALFPENTWFVKNAPHVAADYGTEFSDFTFTLLESETQPFINTFSEYPQFMTADDSLDLKAQR